MDALSFVGNACSVLGFGLSLWSVILTYTVKWNVRKIEREFTQRLHAADWFQELAKKIVLIQGILSQVFQEEEARRALSGTIALLRSIAIEASGRSRERAENALKELERVCIPGKLRLWWRTQIIHQPTLTRDEMFEINLRLSELRDELQQHTRDITARPHR